VRLYFHLVTDRETILDPEGVEVDSVDQALAEALRALDELRKENADAPRGWSGWALNITTAGGEVILTVDLGLGPLIQ
jgi:hypothetical protein